MDYTYDNQMPAKHIWDHDMQMPALAMTYSPKQPWAQVYCAQDGLSRGTIFYDLDKPFCKGACICV